MGAYSPSDLTRQTRLAHTRCADQRNDPVAGHCALKLARVLVPPNQPCPPYPVTFPINHALSVPPQHIQNIGITAYIDREKRLSLQLGMSNTTERRSSHTGVAASAASAHPTATGSKGLSEAMLEKKSKVEQFAALVKGSS